MTSSEKKEKLKADYCKKKREKVQWVLYENKENGRMNVGMNKKALFEQIGGIMHGGDYNPEQWLDRPDILEQDM